MEYANKVYVKFYYGDYLMHRCFDLDDFTPISRSMIIMYTYKLL